MLSVSVSDILGVGVVLIILTMGNLRFMRAAFKIEMFLRFFNPVQLCHKSTYLADLAVTFLTYSMSLNVLCFACWVIMFVVIKATVKQNVLMP